MEKIIVNLFWTGGLDSTFRLCELSREPIIIQPYYEISQRKSTKYELKAMKKILDSLKFKKSTNAEILPLICIDERFLPNIESTFNAWKCLYQKYRLGWQYEKLAYIANFLNINLEVSLEKSNRSKAVKVLTEEGNLVCESYIPKNVKGNKDILEFYHIGSNASSNVKEIFDHLIFPKHLFSITKEEEIDWLKKNEFEDIMKLTWFCHDPIAGKPCGFCNPCKDALNEGLKWRLSKTGKFFGFFRYNLFKRPKALLSRFR